MKALMISTAAAFATLAASPLPVMAQDLGVLDRHLQHQQQTRVQDHQNRMRSGPVSPRAQTSTTHRQCSADALPASERARMETRYREIERRDGRSAAQAYVREQGRLFADRLVADGICTADGQTVSQARSAPSRRGTEQAGGCRMEMVPVAGLGGSGMTMGMVPVCD